MMSSAHGGGAAQDDQRGLEALHRLDEECVHYQRAVRGCLGILGLLGWKL